MHVIAITGVFLHGVVVAFAAFPHVVVVAAVVLFLHSFPSLEEAQSVAENIFNLVSSLKKCFSFWLALFLIN